MPRTSPNSPWVLWLPRRKGEWSYAHGIGHPEQWWTHPSSIDVMDGVNREAWAITQLMNHKDGFWITVENDRSFSHFQMENFLFWSPTVNSHLVHRVWAVVLIRYNEFFIGLSIGSVWTSSRSWWCKTKAAAGKTVKAPPKAMSDNVVCRAISAVITKIYSITTIKQEYELACTFLSWLGWRRRSVRQVLPPTEIDVGGLEGQTDPSSATGCEVTWSLVGWSPG